MKFYSGIVTGSLIVNGTQTINGTLTAQTLIVQTITSSISIITGSTQFGSSSANTHQFTGSLLVTGSTHTILGNLGVGGVPNERLSITGTNSSQGFARWADGTTSAFLGISGSTAFVHANNNILGFGSSGTNVFNPIMTLSGSRVGVGGTTTPVTTLHVSGSSDTLGRVVRFNNSFNSASIDISHANNGGSLGFANVGSGNLSNVFFVTTGAGTIGSGIVMNNAGHVGFATSNVTESVQATGTISIITNSSVSSGPLIQFSGNGRIRPASGGDRLSIDGNALFLNSSIGGNIITNTAGGGFSIGRSDVPSAFNVSGSTNGSTPVIDIKASGAGAFCRGVRMLNSTMTNPSSLMYAVGYADNSRNMGQFYFYFTGDGSTGNRLSMGLHSVDDVFNIFGSGNVVIGQTSDPGYKLAVNGQPGAAGYTAWVNYSDVRLKENIVDLDSTNILSKISSLRPVTFNYNELSGYDEKTRSRRISGFIAQELQEIFPEMVGTFNINDTEYYDTNTSNLQLYLVEAIKELKVQNDSLQSQIDELKNK